MKRLATTIDLDGMFRQLAAKYAVDVPETWRFAQPGGQSHFRELRRENEDSPRGEGSVLAAGWTLLDAGGSPQAIPLRPWQSERRFVELRRLVETRTIEPVVMGRFSCLTTGAPRGLEAILYREFDLAEWLVGSPIVAMHASIADGRAANVLARLANGVICSVEAGTTLPAGSAPGLLDRHELIARRGVASDRVVDTQVPQSSIYTFTDRGREEYTDTDAELFGLEADAASLVRAALELAGAPDPAARAAALKEEHRRLVGLVELARESDRVRRRLAVEGGAA